MLSCKFFKSQNMTQKIFSNCVFNVKIALKKWLQVLKSVNCVFFTH